MSFTAYLDKEEVNPTGQLYLCTIDASHESRVTSEFEVSKNRPEFTTFICDGGKDPRKSARNFKGFHPNATVLVGVPANNKEELFERSVLPGIPIDMKSEGGPLEYPSEGNRLIENLLFTKNGYDASLYYFHAPFACLSLLDFWLDYVYGKKLVEIPKFVKFAFMAFSRVPSNLDRFRDRVKIKLPGCQDVFPIAELFVKQVSQGMFANSVYNWGSPEDTVIVPPGIYNGKQYQNEIKVNIDASKTSQVRSPAFFRAIEELDCGGEPFVNYIKAQGKKLFKEKMDELGFNPQVVPHMGRHGGPAIKDIVFVDKETKKKIFEIIDLAIVEYAKQTPLNEALFYVLMGQAVELHPLKEKIRGGLILIALLQSNLQMPTQGIIMTFAAHKIHEPNQDVLPVYPESEVEINKFNDGERQGAKGLFKATTAEQAEQYQMALQKFQKNTFCVWVPKALKEVADVISAREKDVSMKREVEG